MNIALFGTSADPPTAGHQEILTWLAQSFDLVAVWASDNPFKSHRTSLRHRMTMLELVIAEINQGHVQIYPELSSPRTIITLDKARQKWLNADFTFVIGSDLVASASNHQGLPILSWYRVEELLTQVKLLVVPRPSYPISNADLQQLELIGAKVAIADLTGLPVSSTAYREQGDTTTLTPLVEAYIQKENLYTWQDGVSTQSNH